MSAEPLPLNMTPAAGWQRRFFTIWGGQAFSILGSQLVQFALIWYLTEQTDSAATLATASLVGLLPGVLLSPFIGALVDRGNRRRILIVADASVALATLVLALLFAWEQIAIWHIYGLMLWRAVGAGFHQSAMGASVVLLVPPQHLTRIQGLNQTLHGGLNLAAAPLGAFLLGLLPMQAILALDIFTALLAIGPLLVVSIPQPPRQITTDTRPTFGQDLRAGLAYVRGWPALLIILLMVTLINFLLTPVGALLPLLVTRHFGGDVWQLGWLQAASSGGVIAGGLLLSVWGGFQRRVVTAMSGLIGLGVGVMITAAAPADAFWLALVAMGWVGLMMPITNGSFGAALQASIAPDMQGRVFALVLSAATAMSPLGLMLAGPLADRVGIQPWFWLGGLVCASMGVVGFLTPTVMRLEAGR